VTKSTGRKGIRAEALSRLKGGRRGESEIGRKA